MVRNRTAGFTLVEILVVVGIVSTLSLIVFPSLSGSREKGRDAARVADIEQLSVALRLYAEQHGSYPDEADGVRLGEGGSLDTDLDPYIEVSHDPSGPGDADRYYVYDSSFDCPLKGGAKIALYANEMEREGNGNWRAICDAEGSEMRYGVILN